MGKMWAAIALLLIVGCGGENVKVREDEGIKGKDTVIGEWAERTDKESENSSMTTVHLWKIEAEQITATSKCYAQSLQKSVSVTVPINVTDTQIETLNNAAKKEQMLVVDGVALECEAKIRKSQLDYKVIAPGLIEIESPNSQEKVKMNRID